MKLFFIMLRQIGLMMMLLWYVIPLFSQQVEPYRYWSFDNDDYLRDEIGGYRIKLNAAKALGALIDSGTRKFVDLERDAGSFTTHALKDNISSEFSIEFLFKGCSFDFRTFSDQRLIVRFGYPYILFRTTHTFEGDIKVDDFRIDLDGASVKSYNYYNDGNWHHLVFTYSSLTGDKSIWIDGVLHSGFSKKLKRGGKLMLGSNDGFTNTDWLDNLAFYNFVLPAECITAHYLQTLEGGPYSFPADGICQGSREKERSEAFKTGAVLDSCEFAPGYPHYSVQAKDQLKRFPRPRYNKEKNMKRNVSWMDITYLHRELPGEGGLGIGRSDIRNAILLTEQMARDWNYYIDIPLLRRDSISANREYGDPRTVAGALIEFSNLHPEYLTSTILIEAQIRPVHAGFESKLAYAASQDLPPNYYLKDKNGHSVIWNKRKWLSPLAPLDIIQHDGQTSKFYLNQLQKYLKRPPALINENGELFGHFRKEELWRQDPAVWAHYVRSGMTLPQYSGWFQHRMDSTYKSEVMKGLSLSRTHFSFYNVSALNPEYWPDYEMRRYLNIWNRDTVYATPDFYPRTPDNWWNARGAFNGYGAIARGRVREIELGDKFFSPFVAAGWGREEDNIRPAQWLALLKAMVMLGADFFYTGYFNLTGANGKWPNGFGPYDPRGYAYQIVVPSYAQAMRSWVPDFFENGVLLNSADTNDLVRQYRFKGEGENELILVRQLGKKYLIYGSLQPNSNVKGNVPQQKPTTIELDGEKISFMIRRQGSIYVLDLSSEHRVFYQIDGWHQYEHPYRWDSKVNQEAEVFSSAVGSVRLITEKNSQGTDFCTFTTYCELGRTGELIYAFDLPRRSYTLSIRARSRAGGQLLKVETNNSNSERSGNSGIIEVKGGGWAVYEVPVIIADGAIEQFIRLSSQGEGIQIDKLTIDY